MQDVHYKTLLNSAYVRYANFGNEIEYLLFDNETYLDLQSCLVSIKNKIQENLFFMVLAFDLRQNQEKTTMSVKNLTKI